MSLLYYSSSSLYHFFFFVIIFIPQVESVRVICNALTGKTLIEIKCIYYSFFLIDFAKNASSNKYELQPLITFFDRYE